MTIRSVTTDADWEGAVAVRNEVFVIEQACPPELEWDEHDAPERRGRDVHHLVAWDAERPVAAARWRAVAVSGGGAAKLERIAVRADARGRGLARRIVARCIDDARAAGYSRFVLHAQAYLMGFYESFGFSVEGDKFEEAGIEHVKMTLTDG